jgi:hypothetical protein
MPRLPPVTRMVLLMVVFLVYSKMGRMASGAL